MATSDAVLQVLSGAGPRSFSSDLCFSNLDLAFRSKHIKYVRKRASRHMKMFKCSSVLQDCIGKQWFKRSGDGDLYLSGNATIKRLQLLRCKCQQAERVSGVTTEGGNGKWFVDGAKTLNLNGAVNSPGVLELGDTQQLTSEKEELVEMPLAKASVDPIEEEAWELLRDSVVYYCGSPIGTIAANDPTGSSVLNYDQVFIRDFIPSGIAFLLKGEYDIVRNFLLHTLQLQSWEKTMDCHSPGQGLMPASFKVRTFPLDGDDSATEEVLDPDFGEAAIGRVAPVDSGLWWIILLRAYGKCSDGSCMIDRRMGIHGHPLEIQALFYSALLGAREMLTPEDGSADLLRALNNRLVALSFHIREYYWIDLRKLNEIYRYKTEEYSYDAVNKFNIYPDQVSTSLVEWMPNQGGYLIGNLQPAHMDFRFFSLGNMWSIVSGLATRDQSNAILDLIEAKWSDLVADMPLKICHPALEGQEWQIITGSDPKNTPWSYHNGGSWPTLLWQLTVACIKMNRPEIAARAIEIAEKRLSRDKWPEYYDTKKARFIGKQARLFQTWSIAGYLVAKLLLADPSAARMLVTDEDPELVNAFSCMISSNPRRKRGQNNSKKPFII
ncbi:hypothetical protein OIU85_006808 [Salix viminalis]|uniref:Alkaline/neutral invertase n=1 Tax=Salix viminalis TaxID=40686 RepID=A0A9Q0PLP2_SALVM|nr:hypothetical protein OIU85_006808 [Salix viminalis]